jgi:serine protease
MVDASAAVAAAAATPVARIQVSTTTPTAASPVQLTADASSAPAGRTVSSYAWELVDGGGIVNGFSTATNAVTASLLPSAAGTFTVRLTVTDSLGAQATTQLSVSVVAAAVVTPPTPTPPPTPAPEPSSGSGGGALSGLWLCGLALAAWGLRPRRVRTVPGRSGGPSAH